MAKFIDRHLHTSQNVRHGLRPQLLTLDEIPDMQRHLVARQAPVGSLITVPDFGLYQKVSPTQWAELWPIPIEPALSQAARDSLLVWWSLDEPEGEIKRDSHTGGYDLTQSDSVPSGAGVQGGAAYSEPIRYQNPGIGALFINSDGSDLFSLRDQAAFTVAHWYKSTPPYWPPIRETGLASWSFNHRCWWFEYTRDTAMFSWNVGNHRNVYVQVEMPRPAHDVWHLVIGTFERDTAEATLQVDNGEILTAAYDTPPIPTSTEEVVIAMAGREVNLTPFQGLTDEVAIFKAKLSDEDRAALWAGGAGLDYVHAMGGVIYG